MSCASLPDPQEANQGIVVFAHNLENEAFIDIFGQFKVTLKNIGTNKEITRQIPKKTGIVKIPLEPGTYRISNLVFIYDYVQTERSAMDMVGNVPAIKVNKGEVVIIKNMMRTFTEKKGPKTTLFYNITPATNSEIDDIKSQLLAMKNSEMWDIK